MRRARIFIAATVATTAVACGNSTSPHVPAQPAPAVVQYNWGPTSADLERARSLVSGWDSDRLAGQLIVGRFKGTDPAVAADLVRRLHLAGMSVQGSNVANAAQVRALTKAITDAEHSDGRDFPPIIGVDQEGGTVEHLRGIATEFPPFAAAGATIESDPVTGPKVVQEAARTLGLELRDFGFTWVFAPDADVTIGPGDVTIGTRSASRNADTASKAVSAAIAGYHDAGIVSTPKHFPGHGSATTDSHVSLPNISKSMDQLRDVDLKPFESAIQAGANAVMVGHLNVQAVAPGMPSTLAPEIYKLIRDDLKFEGVAITDSMGMGAVTSRDKPEVSALLAGADLVLMPADTAIAHSAIKAAIDSGKLSRDLVIGKVAKVIALQLWQQRVADEKAIPADISTQAVRAASALER
ncbi:MAG: glycosyl hyrolase family 3 [Nocardiaceae bacterium]|nr:glycosyl hyrolase family 3 [Nocardiaceae bacterium]